MTELFPEFFRRNDETPDALFYQHPREASHIDAAARAAARSWYEQLFPEGGRVLDLCAGLRSHLPEHLSHVIGIGLCREELDRNPRIDEGVVHDLNADPTLPIAAATLDGAVCTVSVQYLVHPVELFTDVARSLRPGAPFAIAFSTRMFPSKAVLAWRASDDAAHHRLVREYVLRTGAFDEPETRRHVPDEGDPLYAVIARRRASS